MKFLLIDMEEIISYPSGFSTGNGDLDDELVSSSTDVDVENGWYEAGSGKVFFRSCPFGRLNWTCDSGFEMLMFPDLMSFRATSRASRASFGRFKIIGFSGSGFVLRACNCFF